MNKDFCQVFECDQLAIDVLVFLNPNIWDLPICQGHLIQYVNEYKESYPTKEGPYDER